MDTDEQALTDQRGLPDAAWQMRPARPDDADGCAALAVVAWQRVHDTATALLGAPLHDELFAGWREAKAAAVTAAVRDHPAQALVAVTPDGQIVGFVTFSCDRERRLGEIGNNAVAPPWQGRGIATSLYRAVLDQMRAAGMRVACVRTGLDDGHAPARAAYQKVGFAAGLPSITYYQELR
jgi:GNAT superfamily N-acetyltransferase